MDLKFVLAFSVLLQFTAAFLAFRLIRLTGKRKAWLLISAAISLMAIRRSITLWRMISEGLAYPPDPAAEWVALATSALLVAGIALISPLFLSIKRSEEAQRKINRALRILSSVNEVIIHSTEESTLLKDACRIIVEIGRYRMSWVGFAEQDEAKTVRPMTHAGHDDGYLNMKFTWADTEYGRSPTGKAVRTGKPFVVKNILTDPDYDPWRAEATKRGYASMIAIPLIVNSQTFGALNIYAAETNAFNEEEMKLLIELVDDLTYGIMALRTRAERKQAEEELWESQERYRALVDNNVLGIAVMDTNYRIIMVNSTFAKLFKKSASDFAGKYCFREFEKREAVCQHCPGTRAMVSGKTEEVETQGGVRDDGTSYYVHNRAAPFFGSDGMLKGFIEMVDDITEHKLAEDALRKSEEKLQERVKELEEFYDMAIGRELRMIELKEEIERLKERSEKQTTQ